MLWAAAAALVLMALAFTAWPLLRGAGPPRSVASRRALLRAQYRDRVAELAGEAASGQLDPENRAAVEAELGANLLDEFHQTQLQARDDAEAAFAREQSDHGRVGAAVWVLLALLPVAGIGIYLSAGEPDAATVAGAQEVLRLNPDTQRADIEAWRDRLARRVASRPDETESWYLLGISRLQLGEFAAAAEAMASVHRLGGDDPNIDLYWLQSRYLAAGGTLDERSRSIAQRLLAARPNHPMVLEMFAIEAYRGGDFRRAVEFLNQALSSPMAAAQAQTLLAGLAQARSRMAPLNPSIDVNVAVPQGAPRNGTVFVIARPPGGGMPYAVLRRPAELLPLAVRLDATAGMSEATSLANAAEVEVVVRLSRSGNPQPAAGDWEWRSEPLNVAALDAPLALEADLAPMTGRSADAAAPVARSAAESAAVSVVDVRVSAPPAAPRDATLFVIARPPGGGMPLAVVRRRADEMPLTVRLDDSASMVPARKLSSADQFEVVVRLSLAGTAAAGPGDWEWRSDLLNRDDLSRPLRLQAELRPRPAE